jgi:hypothetical protein
VDDSEEEIGLEDPDEMEEDEGPISQVFFKYKYFVYNYKIKKLALMYFRVPGSADFFLRTFSFLSCLL